MNRKETIQFIVDSAVINELSKTAGIGDVLQGAESYVKRFIKRHVDTSSKASFIKSIISLLEPAMFFRIHPVLGVLSGVGKSVYGISVTSIFSDIISKIMPKVEKGEQVSEEEVKRAGESVVGDFESAASIYYEFKKTAQKKQPYGGAALLPSKGTPALKRIFGFLGQAKGTKLIGAFLVWFLKTFLAGVGLLAGAGAVREWVGDEEPEFEEKPPTEKRKIPTKEKQEVEKTVRRKHKEKVPARRESKLESSGAGEKYHKNDETSMWIVPIFGNVENTLLSWTFEIYPQLEDYKNLISRNPTFNRIVREMQGHIDPRKAEFIIMPKNVNTRKQLVDTFVVEIEDKVKNEN